MKIIFLTTAFVIAALLYIGGKKAVFDPFGKCKVSQRTFQSQNDKDFFIKARVYNLKNTKTNKTILLLPPTGGENILDVGYSYRLCKQGFKVFSLIHWTQERGDKDYALDFNVHQRYMTRTQQAIRLSLEQINEEKIGVLGTSSGAINFSVALSDPEIAKKVSAFYNIVGGAPLCNVIARAGESALLEVRKKRFKEFNFKNENEYVDKICSKVFWKVPKTKPDTVKFAMTLASKDSTVPYDLQKNLVKWWNPESVKVQPHGHFVTILKTFFTQKKQILDFFETHLK